MKRFLVLLIAALLIGFLQYGCGGGGSSGGTAPPPPPPPPGGGALADFAPVVYQCQYREDLHRDALVIEGNGSVSCGYIDAENNVTNENGGVLDATQTEELKNLLIAAGFNLPDAETVYGDAESSDKAYVLVIKTMESGQKAVIICGENPPDAPSAYIALKDYLKSLFQQLMN